MSQLGEEKESPSHDVMSRLLSAAAESLDKGIDPAGFLGEIEGWRASIGPDFPFVVVVTKEGGNRFECWPAETRADEARLCREMAATYAKAARDAAE